MFLAVVAQSLRGGGRPSEPIPDDDIAKAMLSISREVDEDDGAVESDGGYDSDDSFDSGKSYDDDGDSTYEDDSDRPSKRARSEKAPPYKEELASLLGLLSAQPAFRELVEGRDDIVMVPGTKRNMKSGKADDWSVTFRSTSGEPLPRWMMNKTGDKARELLKEGRLEDVKSTVETLWDQYFQMDYAKGVLARDGIRAAFEALEAPRRSSHRPRSLLRSLLVALVPLV